MSFQLDPRLQNDTHFVGELPLNLVLLMNDARYPWCILVPRRPDLKEVFDLEEGDQTRFWQEITAFAHELHTEFQADKMNVATLGNMVPQLHAHLIARFTADDAWPGPVWGKFETTPYGETESQEMLAKIKRVLENTARGL